MSTKQPSRPVRNRLRRVYGEEARKLIGGEAIAVVRPSRPEGPARPEAPDKPPTGRLRRFFSLESWREARRQTTGWPKLNGKERAKAATYLACMIGGMVLLVFGVPFAFVWDYTAAQVATGLVAVALLLVASFLDE